MFFLILGIDEQIERQEYNLQTTKVLLPFEGEHTFLFTVAGLTTGNKIIFGTEPTPREGNQMIHGDVFIDRFSVAVMAFPSRCFLLPPTALTEIPSLGSLGSHMGIIRCIKIEEISAAHFTSSPRSKVRAAPIK